MLGISLVFIRIEIFNIEKIKYGFFKNLVTYQGGVFFVEKV
jgi:hypothetical protein